MGKIKHSGCRMRLASLMLVFVVSIATGQYFQAHCSLLLTAAVTICCDNCQSYRNRPIRRHYFRLSLLLEEKDLLVRIAIVHPGRSEAR